jgi:hypothetical protein
LPRDIGHPLEITNRKLQLKRPLNDLHRPTLNHTDS